jgi:hypothetical protein
MNRPIRMWLLIACLLISGSAFSQTLYQIRYSYTSEGVTDKFNSFILRNDDGTGMIRVTYIDNTDKKKRLVELEMQETYGQNNDGTEDTSVIIFVGLNPRFIIGNKEDEFLEDHYAFTFNTDSGFYEPAFVFSMPDDSSQQMGTVDEIRFLNQEDLTKELVSQFFLQQEDFYKQLFETSTRGLTADEKQARLHLVLVANTEDKEIGKTCVIDKEATFKTFSDIAEFLEIQFKPTVIAGKDFSKVNVDKAVSAIQPAPNDIVVFYYSGHGFNNMDEQYMFPYLDLRDKSFQRFGGAYTLNVETIYQKLRSKGARLNLVISDCCNNDPTSASMISAQGATTRTSSIGWSMENCQALFMSTKPTSILMTAARKGELSAGNPANGGIFTFMFREQLEKSLGPFSKNPTWNNLLTQTRTETVKKAFKTWCNDAETVRCKQDPIYKVE